MAGHFIGCWVQMHLLYFVFIKFHQVSLNQHTTDLSGFDAAHAAKGEAI